MPRRNRNARQTVIRPFKLRVRVLVCKVHCKAFEHGEKLRAVAEYIA